MPDERIAELEARLRRFERARALCEAVDARLEEALQRREPLAVVVPDLLALVEERSGAAAGAVRTIDESLSTRSFVHGPLELTEPLLAALGPEPARRELDGRAVLVHPLDVAGQEFGHALLVYDGPVPDDAADLLARFAEQLDNHLAAVAAARRQFEVIRAISDALKDPVLDRGIDRAFEILRGEVDLRDLVLLFRHEDELESDVLRYKVHLAGAPAHDSADVRDPDMDAFMRAQAVRFLDGDDAEVRARFGMERCQEEVLITGVRAARVVGRMLVTSEKGEFHTHDRELLDRFADYLRQRIVDFNREWKQLATIFSTDVCARLLGEEGYVERYLTPRERECAIFYGDIAGFTRVSEQVLRTPEAIGRLIHTFAEGAVEILWAHGGAFDKMVGDCVIGLFGPPFYEDDPADRCARALAAAEAIRAHTRALSRHPALPELAGHPPLDIAVGLSFCPISVGLFGPDEDFTGFSSGMNNTARLQGVATGGEILCMEAFVEALGDASGFSEPLSAKAKNVAEPLRYRRLTR